MFDLNDDSLNGGVAIFNGGNAGKVNNVTMSVTKKLVTDMDNAPDYKLIFTTDNGTSINQGFYHFTPNTQKSEEQNSKNEGYLVTRILSAAKAVVPKDYKFPEVANVKEAVNALFTIIAENTSNNKVNVFTTYGTPAVPNKKGYLGVRYFDFVESADTPENVSRLKVKNTDLMERIVPDAPSDEPATTNKVWGSS